MTRPLLVTAFEPFAGASINPSEEGVRALAKSERCGSRVRATILPVTYDGARLLLAERMRVEDPVGVLMFGVSRDATGLVIESCAYNVCDAQGADNAGTVRRGDAVIARAPDRLEAGPIAERLATALEARNVPVRRSSDPGRFVCNSTYFAALFHARARPVVFVHVPVTAPMGGTVTPDALQSWMEAAVESYLERIDAVRV
jgi:pyroglutamyl-peptidase